MHKKTIGVIVLVLVVVSLAVAGALLFNNGKDQNTDSALNSTENSLLGGAGGNGGTGGLFGSGGNGGNGGATGP
jgi:hypothetical protein